MGENGAPRSATNEQRRAWAYLAGLIALVAATVIITAVATRGPGALDRAPGARSNYPFSPANLDSAASDLQRAVAQRVVPGAALAIGDRGRIVDLTGFGRVGWSD